MDIAGELLKSAGARYSERELPDGRYEVSCVIPTHGRPVRIVAVAGLPMAIGRRRKFGRRFKKFVKKVAKSKFLKVLKKVGPMLASVVPGGQALSAGIALAGKVSTVVKAAKRGNPKARRIIARAKRLAHQTSAKNGHAVKRSGPSRVRTYKVRLSDGRTASVVMGS